MRIDWAALPKAVTEQVADRAGGSHVTPASAGDHAEVAATVAGARGKVFVKAARSDLAVRSLRYEVRVSEAVSRSHSPAVEWYFEAAGWLVAGFEHCEGPHADLSPGSSDLRLLAAALDDLGTTPAPDVRPFTPYERFGFAKPAMDGDTLVHTDLTAANLIVTRHGLRIVDWAMAAKAAPWVELAALTAWLIGAGHTPEQAEQWLAQRPAWGETDPATLTYFATSNAEKWARKAQHSTATWIHDLANWTGQWAAYRLRFTSARCLGPSPTPEELAAASQATITDERTPVAGVHEPLIGYVGQIPHHTNGWWHSWLPDAPLAQVIGTHQNEAQAVQFLRQLERHRRAHR